MGGGGGGSPDDDIDSPYKIVLDICNFFYKVGSVFLVVWHQLGFT